MSIFVLISSVMICNSASELKLSKTKLFLPVGQSKKIKLLGTDRVPKWSSSDKEICTVSKKGVVTAKAEGEAVISAKLGKQKFTCKVNAKTLIIGHRGFSSEYPENTIYAFDGAFENGFDGIECDVWESEYGTLMIHHDATTDRMTGKSEYIWKVNSQNRAEFPIISGANTEQFSDKTILIPTLTEALKAVKKQNGYFVLHIKLNDGYTLTDKGVKKILRLLDKYTGTSKTIIIGSKTALKRFVGKGYELAVTMTLTNKQELKKNIKWCKKNNVRNVLPIEVKDIKVLGSIKKFANYCKKYDMNFGLYTTPDKKTLEKLRKYGAFFSMTDYKLI